MSSRDNTVDGILVEVLEDIEMTMLDDIRGYKETTFSIDNFFQWRYLLEKMVEGFDFENLLRPDDFYDFSDIFEDKEVLKLAETLDVGARLPAMERTLLERRWAKNARDFSFYLKQVVKYKPSFFEPFD